MSTVQNTFERFEQTARAWLAALDDYDAEQFARKPAEDSWSIGQVYAHLIGTAHQLQFRNIEQCLSGSGAVTKGGKTVPGRLSYMMGSIPPAKIKVPPSREYTPTQPESKETVRREMTELIEAMRATAKKLESAAPNGHKTEHPALGMLDAWEWYQLIEMHFRHHLRQKERLDTFLGVKG